MRTVKKYIVEKFTEDSDPITDMGIGMRHQISKWMKEIGEEDTDDRALTLSASYGKLDFVKYLVQHGANIHIGNDRALRWASENGHLKVVKYLVQNGADIHADDDWAFRWASNNGHLEVVKYLVQKGADIHANDDLALQRASESGHLEVVKFLVQNGANIHADNDLALQWASENGHLEVVKYLVQNGANIHADDDLALQRASKNGHLEVVKYLVQNGADIHIGNDWVLRYASANGHLEVVKYLESQMKKDKIVKESLLEKFVEDSDPIEDMGIGMRHLISKWMEEIGEKDTDDRALTLSASYGKLDFVKYLVQNGADIHADNDWAFRWASNNGHLEVVKYLVQKGADIHVNDDWALRRASDAGHLEVVKFLVQNGANIHANNDHALQLASLNGHLEVVKFLVQNGANIHANNDRALQWASSYGHLEVVKYLVQNGANIHANDDWALGWASSYGHLEVVKYLESQMKKDKIVKESLLEKFVEDSDPITDMGIGIFFPRTFKSEKDLARFLYKNIGPITKRYGYEHSPEFLKRKDITYLHDNYMNAMTNYLEEFVTDVYVTEYSSNIYKYLNPKYRGYSSEFLRLAHENIDEAFTKDSDPIDDMNIGTKFLIKKWLEEKNRKYYKILDDNTIELNQGLSITENLPDYIKFSVIYGDVSIEENVSSLKGLPETIGGFLSIRRCRKLKTLDYAPTNLSVTCFILDTPIETEEIKKYVRRAIKNKSNIIIKIDQAFDDVIEIDTGSEESIEKFFISTLNEKFTEDSDPIDDMGIGAKYIIKNWKKKIYEKDQKTTFKCLPWEMSSIPSKVPDEKDINDSNTQYICDSRSRYIVGSGNGGGIINIVLKENIIEFHFYSNIYVQKKKDGSYKITQKLEYLNGILESLNLLEFLEFVSFKNDEIIYEILPEYVDYFKEGLKESLNEKFIEDSDPIQDMGIGMRHLISKWMKEIGEEDTDDNALVYAASYGKLDFVKHLVQNGANIHADNDGALRWASNNGHLEVVKYLVQNGANIHANNDMALQWASYSGHLEIVKYLVQNGANIRVDKDLALRWASESGHLEVVKYLVQKGANIHIGNDWALRWASKNGHLEVVKYLVQNGANIHADNDGALRYASENGHLEVVKYLESQMNKDKVVKESLLEKFQEDSDPIQDMGIGIRPLIEKWIKDHDIIEYKIHKDKTISVYTYFTQEGNFPDYINLRGADQSIYLKNITSARGLPKKTNGLIHISNSSLDTFDDIPIDINITLFLEDVKFPEEELQKYIDKVVKNKKIIIIRINKSNREERVIYTSELIKDNTINEKFIKDSNPIDDMGIGLEYRIKKWFDDTNNTAQGVRYIIRNDKIRVTEGNLIINGNLPDFINFESAHSNTYAKNITSAKGFPEKIDGLLRIEDSSLNTFDGVTEDLGITLFLKNTKFSEKELAKYIKRLYEKDRRVYIGINPITIGPDDYKNYLT